MPGSTGRVYLLGSVRLEGVSGELLTIPELESVEVQLRHNGEVYSLVLEGEGEEAAVLSDLRLPDRSLRPVDKLALDAIVNRISQAYTGAGYAAVRVTVRRDSLERLRDPDGDGVLIVHITEGRAADVRTRSVKDHDKINLPRDHSIREHSPIRAGDPIDLQAVEDYIDFLNRHPRRRIDAALSPGERSGEIIFDYLIYETRPWLIYFQASNTGTEQTTEWREQVGLLHYDFSGTDDILAVNYAGGDFDSTHAGNISYERPFDADPRLRWRIFGDWSRYDASEVGLPGVSFQGEGWGAGGELSWNFHQDGRWFYDAIGGVRFRHTMTDNAFATLTGETDFLIAYAGLRVEQRDEVSSTNARIMFETNLPRVAGTDVEEVRRLGRTDADDHWVLLKYDGAHAFYLDGLFGEQPSRWDSNRPIVNQIVLSLRGQTALGDQRLPPNYTSTIGGLYSVRGYPEVFASADNSVIGSVEYRYHVARGLEPQPRPGTLFGNDFRYRPHEAGGRADWDLILKAFIDAGRVWHNDRLSFEDNATLIGSGVGVEVQVKQNISFQVDWGWALRDVTNGSEQVDAGSSRTHFLFTLTF